MLNRVTIRTQKSAANEQICDARQLKSKYLTDNLRRFLPTTPLNHFIAVFKSSTSHVVNHLPRTLLYEYEVPIH